MDLNYYMKNRCKNISLPARIPQVNQSWYSSVVKAAKKKPVADSNPPEMVTLRKPNLYVSTVDIGPVSQKITALLMRL